MVLKYTNLYGMNRFFSLRIVFIDGLLENIQVNFHVP